MTEIDWLSHLDPAPMLRFLRNCPGLDRKLRLFAVACCAPFAGEFPGPHYQEALDEVERFADLPSDDEKGRTLDLVGDAFSIVGDRQALVARAVYHTAFIAQPRPVPNAPDGFETHQDLFFTYIEQVSRFLIDAAQSPDRIRNSYALRAAERLFHSNLIRDVAGNPFRPAALDARWLTSTVNDLSHAIYQERAFDRLPILADALMDAGCDSEEMISHCRCEGPHVRGCWVVDLLLAKS